MYCNINRSLEEAIRKAYHCFLISLRREVNKSPHLLVTKCKWMNNAYSPVVLMIDDLTNAWYDRNSNGRIDIGEDWGAAKYSPNSALSFLHKYLFEDFPYMKITFFTVLGKISPFGQGEDFTYSARINETADSTRFFRMLNFNNRYEIAYHGLNHGSPGHSHDNFTQEWLTFTDLRHAINQIREGISIYNQTFGANPCGGKYCGYTYNSFSDLSVQLAGFKWWCRDFCPAPATESSFGQDHHELSFFGKTPIVNIPSNIHGFWWQKKQISSLIANKQIIAVQEHIAPYRPDNKIQKPNVVDDIWQLRRLFHFLRRMNVWYATCGEIAEYFEAYSHSTIFHLNDNSFEVNYWGRSKTPMLSLQIDVNTLCSSNKPFIEIILPNGCLLSGQHYKYDTATLQHLVTLPLLNGTYCLKPVANPVTNLEAAVDASKTIRHRPKNMTGQVDLKLVSDHFYYVLDTVNKTSQPLKQKNPSVYTYFCNNSSSKYILKRL